MLKRYAIHLNVLLAVFLLGAAAHAAISLSGPSSLTVTQGQQVSGAIQLAKQGKGKPETATFSVSGLPAGASGKFSPASCKATCSTTLTVSTQPTITVGTYQITVRAQTPTTAAFLGISLIVNQSGGGQVGTYYIAPTGNDTTGDGTIDLPWATIGKFHTSAASPGDTLYLRGGTYDLTAMVYITKDGTEGNPITIQNYTGETPILDGTNVPGTTLDNGNAIYLDSASWWHIKGLEVKNAPADGIMVRNTSTNNIIEMNNVHNNGTVGGSGIRVMGVGAANNLVLNNDAHHNVDPSAGGADGFALGGVSGAGNVVRGNRAWRNSDDGFDFFNSNDGTTGAAWIIENNWSWENGLDDNLDPTGGNGNGIKLGGIRTATGGTSGPHIVRNNLVWRNYAHGFDQNGGQGGTAQMTVYNNTAWSNNVGNIGANGFQFNYAATPGSIFRNNANLSPGAVAIHAGASVNEYNSWNGVVTLTLADFVSSDFSGATGARQGDGSLPVLTFLHLVEGSDLIDAGVDVGLSYTGAAPDMGAHEYGALSPTRRSAFRIF